MSPVACGRRQETTRESIRRNVRKCVLSSDGLYMQAHGANLLRVSACVRSLLHRSASPYSESAHHRRTRVLPRRSGPVRCDNVPVASDLWHDSGGRDSAVSRARFNHGLGATIAAQNSPAGGADCGPGVAATVADDPTRARRAARRQRGHLARFGWDDCALDGSTFRTDRFKRRRFPARVERLSRQPE